MANYTSLLDMVYPVGAVYISYASTSPALLFGGTWLQLEDVVLRAANNTNTGGSDTHTLTIAEMPAHTHNDDFTNSTGSNYDGYNMSGGNTKRNTMVSAKSTGGGQPHNNLPAYQNLYVWRRTA